MDAECMFLQNLANKSICIADLLFTIHRASSKAFLCFWHFFLSFPSTIGRYACTLDYVHNHIIFATAWLGNKHYNSVAHNEQ